MAQETGGSTQCPHLVDPNNNVSMSESKDIIQYLYDTYALYTPPPEILEFMSNKILFPIKPLVAQLAKIQAGAANSEQEEYEKSIDAAESEIRNEIASAPVVKVCESFSYCDWIKDSSSLSFITGKTFSAIRFIFR